MEAVDSNCVSCHAQDDVHLGQLGSDCVACHNAAGWDQVLEEDFDHNLTRWPLTGKHATLATCESCHRGGQLKGTPTECIACHRLDDAHAGKFGSDCVSCHNTTTWTDATFDHNLTRFRLTGAHANLTCQSCHEDGRMQGTPRECVACHRSDDAHAGAFGTSCASCHTTSTWSGASFDHAKTGFSLTGKHKDALCESCHTNGQFAGTPTSCVSCHSQDDAHDGAFGTSCGSCHTTSTWSAASFDHAQTGFSLTGKHKDALCESCHSNGQFAGTPTSCVSCHSQDDAHDGAFGTNCAACHTTSGWGGASFDHGQTGFPLIGQHRDALCESCHVNGQFAGTPTTCISCHSQDDTHDGAFGTDCAACHTPSGWGGASFDHGQTGFPLIGQHRDAQCESCHANGQFAGTPTSCISCHSQDDAHDGAFGTDCASCHTPSGWGGASFDHSQTGFPLSGRHSGVTCTSCHQNGQYSGTPTECASCHAEPGYHSGLFGTNCASCHTTSGWSPAEYNRPHDFPMQHGDAKGQCSSCHTDPLPGYECTQCHKHDPARMAEVHEEKGIPDWSNCLSCHPGGKKD
jgi:hypothetical protein